LVDGFFIESDFLTVKTPESAGNTADIGVEVLNGFNCGFSLVVADS